MNSDLDVFEILVSGRCYYAEVPDPMHHGCWLRWRFYYHGTTMWLGHLMLVGFDLDRGGQHLYWPDKIAELLPIVDPWQPFLHETTMAE